MTMENACRSCGANQLVPVLSLGQTPLANSLLTTEQLDQPENTYPLNLVFCPHCALVQITETVAPDVLFRDYLYFSSVSDAFVRHARTLACRLIEDRALGKDSLVVEMASNDGYLLQNYRNAGIPVLGVEPARNIARVAEERGIHTLTEFFGRDIAQQLVAEGRQADVLHGNNVLAHVADLNGVVAGIALVLKDHGVAVIEAPYVKDMIDHVEFDTIYHEHLCYFSLTALDRLFSGHGLTIIDVERIPVHGGSLRIFAGKTAERSGRVHLLLEEERAWGVDDPAFYAGFGTRVERLRDDLRALLDDLKAQGKRIVGYSASAKGSTLLNYCGIGCETLDYIADRSTAKQGRYTPGTHLPIYDPARLLEAMPDYALLLAWNFADEILAQQAEFRQRDGHFIIPIPEPKVV